MSLTSAEQLLIQGLKVFEVKKGLAAAIFMTLQNEAQMWELIEYMTSHKDATADELLNQARIVAANSSEVRAVAFCNNQIAFMKSIGISVDFSKPLSDADYADIEEKVSEHLQKHGFDANYLPSEDGKLCESILDLLP